MSELRPSVEQMLWVGKDCGLTMLSEAYENYMSHYDLFFLIDDYQAQSTVFNGEIVKHLWTEVDMKTQTVQIREDLSIDDCMAQLGIEYVAPDYSDIVPLTEDQLAQCAEDTHLFDIGE